MGWRVGDRSREITAVDAIGLVCTCAPVKIARTIHLGLALCKANKDAQIAAPEVKDGRVKTKDYLGRIADALETWCKHDSRQIELLFIQKGRPSQNGYIERFNKTFREDILDAHLFDAPAQVQQMANDWIWMYNNERPHESLDNLSPAQFLLKYGKLHPHPRGQDEFPTFQQDNNNKQQITFNQKHLLLTEAVLG